MELFARAAVGLPAAGAIAGFALARRALSRSGAAAALGIGAAIYVGGGAAWFAALVTFFVSSTLLGRVGRARKAATKREFEKGDTRDARQALANGGIAAAAALWLLASPSAYAAAAFLGALATANGDTWATELGVLSRAEPWSLTHFRRVPRGTSGAVSPLGLAATVAGAAAIGAAAIAAAAIFGTSGAAVSAAAHLGTSAGATSGAAIFGTSASAVSGAAAHLGTSAGATSAAANFWAAIFGAPAAGNFWLNAPRFFWAATVGGTVGSLADSLLGATLQSGYRCPACARDTEGPRHHCGAATTRTRGLRGVDNDVVNLLATVAGAAAAALIF